MPSRSEGTPIVLYHLSSYIFQEQRNCELLCPKVGMLKDDTCLRFFFGVSVQRRGDDNLKLLKKKINHNGESYSKQLNS